MTDSAPDVRIEADLPYADVGRPLLWDIYRRAGVAADAPVVLLFHGGGWRFGHRNTMAAAATEFARRGYVAIAPEYRLLGEAGWPAPLDDVRRAIAAIRAGKAGHGATGPVYLAGYSAGAHLSLIAAAGSDDVAGVAAFFPPAKLGPHHAGALGLGADADLSPFSPISHAAALPPTILFCGDEDSMTPAEQSIELHRAIRTAGRVADLRLFSGLIHEFVSLPNMMETTVRDAAEFFDRTSRSKPAFDQALAELRQWWDRMMARPPATAG